MSKDRHLILRAGCVLAFGVACFALYTSTRMNMDMSASNALSGDGKLYQAQAALVVHIAAAVFAFLAGILWRGRSYIGSILLFLLVGGFALYSFSQVVGFGAKERIGKSKTERAESLAAVKKAEAENQARLDERKDNLKWARDTVVKYTGKKSRGETVDTALKIMEKPIEFNAVVNEKTTTDVGIAEAAEWIGAKIELLQLSFVALLAFLLILVEPVGFGLSSALWPRSSRKETNPPPEDRRSKRDDKSSPETNALPPSKPEKPHLRAVATGKISPAEPVVPAVQKALPSPAPVAPPENDPKIVRLPVREQSKLRRENLPETKRAREKSRRGKTRTRARKRQAENEADMALVSEFLAEETIAAPHSCIQSDALWKAFRKWGIRRQKALISHNRFGRAMTALKMNKDKRQRIYYCGIALGKDHKEAMEADPTHWAAEAA